MHDLKVRETRLIPVENLKRTIGATIIDKNEFYLPFCRPSLGSKGFELGAYRTGPVIAREDDTDLHGSPVCCRRK
jgi:hypothetical protein